MSDEANPSIASLADGTLFVAVEHVGAADPQASIYRSLDGGETWQYWFWIIPAEDATGLSLAAGEGNENWLLLTFQSGPSHIAVMRIDLDDGVTWDSTTIYTNANAWPIQLVTDSCESASGIPMWSSSRRPRLELCFTGH